MRLVVSLLLSTIGGVGMWSVVVALPAVQAEFGVARGDASLPYTLTMIGFGLSGIAVGRLSDRFGITVPVMVGIVAMALGYAAAASATTLWQYALAQGLLIGTGSASTFGPLLADISMWFHRRRGTAVGVCERQLLRRRAVVAGRPALRRSGRMADDALRHCGVLRGDDVAARPVVAATGARARDGAAGLRQRRAWPPADSDFRPPRCRPCSSSPGWLLRRDVDAQVHLVAYCGDLGYGAARGAQMLSLMLACGIVSRLGFGLISDRIGGLRTLLVGSGLQGVALLLFLPFDGLVSLYVISALFGLFQGGIVPSYAMIVREHFSPTEAGARVGSVLMATLFGMALGGWMSGVVFDLTGSYKAAFVNGLLWNLLNVSIAAWLLRREVGRAGARAAARSSL